VGDVGQNAIEEIDRIEKGKNYGWNKCEGSKKYNASGVCPVQFEPPIFEYLHSEGVSVTGGYVYRGKRARSLRGTYLYGDYVSQKVWGLFNQGGTWKS